MNDFNEVVVLLKEKRQIKTSKVYEDYLGNPVEVEAEAIVFSTYPPHTLDDMKQVLAKEILDRIKQNEGKEVVVRVLPEVTQSEEFGKTVINGYCRLAFV